jgi:hypothetical protein
VNKPAAGLRIMHNGRAIELLSHLITTAEGQVWKVRPLFVSDPDVIVTILPSDICRPIHSERHRLPPATFL